MATFKKVIANSNTKQYEGDETVANITDKEAAEMVAQVLANAPANAVVSEASREKVRFVVNGVVTTAWVIASQKYFQE